MPYATRLKLAMLGAFTFMTALVLGADQIVPDSGGGAGAHALFAGLGFGALCGAFVRRD